MPRPVRRAPVAADALAAVRVSPRGRIAGSFGEALVESIGLGGRRRPATEPHWHEPSGAFRPSADLFGSRVPRQVLLVLTVDRLAAFEIGPAGRCGDALFEVAAASLGEIAARPGRFVGVPVLHLELGIDDSLLPLLVARPHRGDAEHFVEQWRLVVEQRRRPDEVRIS